MSALGEENNKNELTERTSKERESMLDRDRERARRARETDAACMCVCVWARVCVGCGSTDTFNLPICIGEILLGYFCDHLVKRCESAFPLIF